MSRVCDLTGKRRKIVNLVSHSNKKTKSYQAPNLHKKVIFDPTTGKKVTLRISSQALRTLDKHGSLSSFLKKFS